MAHTQKPNEELTQMMADIQNYLTPKIDRGGLKYKFAWLNVNTQAQFSKLIDVSVDTVPRVILVNPGKRKRFFVMETEINDGNLSKFIY